jgi:putative MATE family efflux protein
MTDQQNSNIKPERSSFRDWTQGPLLRNIVLLSWPMIVTEAVYMVSQLFDMVWVGRSGPAAIAGLGIALVLSFMISTVDMSIISGMRALVSRFMGAGDIENARKTAAQAYILGISWGLLVAVLGFWLAGPLISIFGVSEEVVSEGSRYLRVAFTGWVGMELHVMGLYIMPAGGDSLSSMKLQIVARSVHIILCPFLVLGIAFFPTLGIAGAALSNVISQFVGGLIGLWFIFGGHSRLKLSLKDLRFDPSLVWRMLKIGVPTLISTAQMTASNFVLTWIVSPFGTMALAAHSLVNNINGFVTTPNMGMSGGISVLVGQNLGAQKPQRATRSAWLGAAILESFNILCAIIILIWANSIVSLFSHDPQTVGIAVTFLHIATVGYLVMGISSAIQASINGAGDTLPTMLINIGMTWVVQIPVAFFLSHSTFGLNGVRWATVAGTFFATITVLLYFRFGNWRTKKL